jgi:hypothetical protein
MKASIAHGAGGCPDWETGPACADPVPVHPKNALSAIRNAVTCARSILTSSLTVNILRLLREMARAGPHRVKGAEYLYRALAGASSRR